MKARREFHQSRVQEQGGGHPLRKFYWKDTKSPTRQADFFFGKSPPEGMRGYFMVRSLAGGM